jgi:N-formylglutamate amidohydrolase
MSLHDIAEIAVNPLAGLNEPISVQVPARQSVPFVFASPHSGAAYPADFVASSRLDPLTLRRSEDSFVDEIFAAVPELGAPLLKAHFPRAYCDPNREAFELDPAMFTGALPAYVNTQSSRVRSGLGTIPRLVATGAEIYGDKKISFNEAFVRIVRCWRPYHRRLAQLMETTHKRFGVAILIDCHSMPSIGGPIDRDQGSPRPDIALGDRFGASCAAWLTGSAERIFKELGFNVHRNDPYAGAFSTEHYGRPDRGMHVLQIELNRALYMDETRICRLAASQGLSLLMTEAITALLEAANRATG